MILIRRCLRRWAAACLVFQAATLSALVPRQCCLAHEPPAVETTAVEETCPLHAQAAAAEPEPESDRRCEMRSACDGPAAALFSVLSATGVLTGRFSLEGDTRLDAAPSIRPGRPLGRARSFDPPPPRA